jgi:hypothetical protein
VLEHFVSRVEKAAEVQDSSDASDMSDGKDVDESTMVGRDRWVVPGIL